MRPLRIGLFLALLCALSWTLPSTDAWAQWAENGTAVCTALNDQNYPQMVADGAGGAIITWTDERGADKDVYAQRVNAHGVPQWTSGGVAVCTASGDQWSLKISSDGAEGAIITWADERGADKDVYAQRLDASGVPRWTADGVAICTASLDQTPAGSVSDGAGGAVIAIYYYNPIGENPDIYAQRIDASGTTQWTTNGESIVVAISQQTWATMASDGTGGAIVAWMDSRTMASWDLYGQRIDGSGAVQWTVNGKLLCTAVGEQEDPSIASDGAGGAVVAWEEWRGGDNGIYAQRVTSSGTLLWTTDGATLCTLSSGDRDGVKTATDGSGGAIVTWSDSRGSDRDIYAQRVDDSGAALWTANGVPVCTASGDQSFPQIVSDGAGGVIIAWPDTRTGSGYHIYAQRLDDQGARLWEEYGVPLCTTSPATLTYSRLISDDQGGAIFNWSEPRSGDDDIYAQRVTRQGYWGYPAPEITSVQDVPGDQGGQVVVNFAASRLDTWPDLNITHYSVWRSLSPAASIAFMSGGISLEDPRQANADLVGKAYYSSPTGAWGLVGTVEAHLWSEYNHPVATLRDSTSVDSGMEYFRVSAHSSGTFDFWDSEPDSGYSVDNLPPEAPMALAAEYTGSSDVYLHWIPNIEPDLHHYVIYRGTVPDFVPSEINLLGTTTDTSFVDTGFGYGEHYYKVSAMDIHENESPFAYLTPDMITGVPGESPHYANVLFQNRPNPFLSSTQIAFSMKEPGHVRLQIFDAKGRLVRVLVNEARSANYYVESWDGKDGMGRPVSAGTYFYNLEIPDWKASKKMTLAR